MRRWAVLLALALGCGRIGFDDRPHTPLTVSAAPEPANVNSNVAVTAEGGVPPYTFAIASGGGVIDVTGIYRSPPRPGTAIVVVTDDAGDTAEVAITTGGGTLFGVGGYTATGAFTDVYRSDDAVTWTKVGDLPTPLGGGILWVQDDALFHVGGDQVFDNSTAVDTIYRSTDGMTWTLVGTYPTTISAAGFTVFGGRIWIGPGIEAGDSWNNEVWSSADGITWRPEVPFPVDIHMTRLLDHGGTLYSIAGHEMSAQTADVYALLSGSWTRVGAIEVAGEYHSAAVYDGKMWVAGGLGLGSLVQTSVDGVTWTRTASPMPLSREEGELVEHGGRLYMIAGRPRTTLVTDDGSAWTQVGSYPIDCVGTHVVAFTPR